MIFEYQCAQCGTIIEGDFRVGQAAKTMKCEKCNVACERYYGNSCNFILKGGGWPGKSIKFDREQTDKNEAAGRRMVSERTGTAPKLIDQR